MRESWGLSRSWRQRVRNAGSTGVVARVVGITSQRERGRGCMRLLHPRPLVCWAVESLRGTF